MKNDLTSKDVIIIAAVVIGGYILYKKFIASNPQAAKDTLNDTATKTWTTKYGEKAAYYEDWNGAGTTYFFSDAELNKMNIAQRALLTIDKVIPGNWLTKAVLS